MEKLNALLEQLLTGSGTGADMLTVGVSLAAALGLSLLLWAAYGLANPRGTGQPRFAATLVCLALVTTVLLDLIRSDLALSLGVLGSLSIVRFRTNIRDPRDIGFVCWSMAIGLAAATEHYGLGLAGSLVLTVLMVATAPRHGDDREMLLVVRGSTADLDAVGSVVDRDCRTSSVKAKNVLTDSFELVYTVRIAQEKSSALIGRLFALGGIDSVNLLAGEQPV